MPTIKNDSHVVIIILKSILLYRNVARLIMTNNEFGLFILLKIIDASNIIIFI